jgi:hypothetical protein
MASNRISIVFVCSNKCSVGGIHSKPVPDDSSKVTGSTTNSPIAPFAASVHRRTLPSICCSRITATISSKIKPAARPPWPSNLRRLFQRRRIATTCLCSIPSRLVPPCCSHFKRRTGAQSTHSGHSASRRLGFHRLVHSCIARCVRQQKFAAVARRMMLRSRARLGRDMSRQAYAWPSRVIIEKPFGALCLQVPDLLRARLIAAVIG